MPPKGYRTVTLPIEMVEEIEKIIRKYPEFGYTSLAEFIKDALREKLQKMKEMEKVPKYIGST
ncbi:MAG: ribbon-helix-helix domain-containing protein [Archaeoglobaceae archaeon]